MHSSRMRTTRSLTVSRRILCMPPPATTHTPRSYTCPLKPRTPPKPCMPPQQSMPPCNHACPPDNHAPSTTTHAPSSQACPPPTTTHPSATMHDPPGNHACPLAATHTQQPCTPCNHTHPRQPHTHPHVDRITDACKNITFPQLRLQAVTRMHSSRMRTGCS